MHGVLIVSDSHGLTQELEKIKNRHDVTDMIHCGDSELVESTPQLSGFTMVKGNCDWDGKFPNEEIIEIGTLRFFVTHGHLYGVKQTLLNLQYRAQELGANVVCYGHSHIASAELLDNQLLINPGSIRFPQRFKEPSYAIVTWSEPEKIDVTFFNLSGEIITSFPYQSLFNLK